MQFRPSYCFAIRGGCKSWGAGFSAGSSSNLGQIEWGAGFEGGGDSLDRLGTPPASRAGNAGRGTDWPGVGRGTYWPGVGRGTDLPSVGRAPDWPGVGRGT